MIKKDKYLDQLIISLKISIEVINEKKDVIPLTGTIKLNLPFCNAFV
jgi:hypothetical protein